MYGALLVLRVLTRKYEFRDDVSAAVALYLHGWPLVVFRAQHQARCSRQSAAQAQFVVQLGGSSREGTQHPRDVGNGSSAALGSSRVGGSCLTCLLFASGLVTSSYGRLALVIRQGCCRCTRNMPAHRCSCWKHGINAS
jgi:hypothetical protein